MISEACRYWQNFEDIAADIVVFAMASGRTVDRAELGNRAVSALLRGAASKYPGRVALTGSATTITSSVAEGLSVSDVKGIFASHPSIEVVCKRTAATRKEALKRLKSEDKRDPPEAAASAAENSPAAQVATGSRVFKFSSQYELAVQEYALLTGVSSKKLPHSQAFIVWETIEELRRQGLLHEEKGQELSLMDVVKVVPTAVGAILERCQSYEDARLTSALATAADACFLMHDAGNSGKVKHTYVLLCGFDHLRQRIFQELHSCESLDGGGENTAAALLADLERLDVEYSKCKGQCSDNATDVLKTCAPVGNRRRGRRLARGGPWSHGGAGGRDREPPGAD